MIDLIIRAGIVLIIVMTFVGIVSYLNRRDFREELASRQL